MIDPTYPNSVWSPLVRRVAGGDAAAVSELYQALRGLRFFLARRIGWEAEDAFHDCILVIIKAIREGTLRDPERLAGFAMTVARRHVIRHIQRTVRTSTEQNVELFAACSDRWSDPERGLIDEDRKAIATAVLVALRPKQREALIRFYVKEQSAEEVQAAMGLTATQFRLLKSRAKQRYAELVRNRLICRPLAMTEVDPRSNRSTLSVKVAGEEEIAPYPCFKPLPA